MDYSRNARNVPIESLCTRDMFVYLIVFSIGLPQINQFGLILAKRKVSMTAIFRQPQSCLRTLHRSFRTNGRNCLRYGPSLCIRKSLLEHRLLQSIVLYILSLDLAQAVQAWLPAVRQQSHTGFDPANHSYQHHLAISKSLLS